MKKFKSLLALVLALAMVLMTSACSAKTPAATDGTDAATESAAAAPTKTRATTSGKADNSMTVSIHDTVSTLDPELFMRTAEDEILMQIYEPLFYIGNDGNLINGVMDSLTVNEDGSVDFVLQENVQFHSGDILKSEDVEYTLQRTENSPLCSPMFGVVKMTITDDTHFTWTFEGADFESMKAYIEGMCIVNKSYCEGVISNPNEDLGLNCDGTGPYVFVEKNGNGDVKLEKFANYHATTSLDTLNFKYITGSQETAFEAGDLDYAQYGATNYALLGQYSNVSAVSQVLNSVCFVISNCVEGQPTSDIRVREAMARCMNRDDLCSIGSDDAGTVAYNLATPLVADYADVADHFDMDIEKANQLMTEAGYSESNKLPLTLIVVSAQTSWVSACEVMKEELEQSYFEVTIEEVADTSRYFTYDFDIALISISLTSQFNSYGNLFDTSTGLNLAGLEDENVKAAFSAITDQASTQNAMKVATESLAYIPLFYNTTFFAFDDQLNQGPFYTEFSAFLYRDFSWKD